jgi:LemA protein
MSTGQLLLVAGAALLVFWTLGAYNRLQALRNAIIQAWAQVDEPLQRRSMALAGLLARQPANQDTAAGAAAALPGEASAEAPAGALSGAPAFEPDDVPAELAAELSAAQAALDAAAEALRRQPASAERAATLAAAEAALAAPLAQLLQRLGPSVAAPPAQAALHATLQDAAQRIAFARQLFNDAVQGYNDAVRQFPTRLLSGLFGFVSAGPL